jgi:hypothetical protein
MKSFLLLLSVALVAGQFSIEVNLAQLSGMSEAEIEREATRFGNDEIFEALAEMEGQKYVDQLRINLTYRKATLMLELVGANPMDSRPVNIRKNQVLIAAADDSEDERNDGQELQPGQCCWALPKKKFGHCNSCPTPKKGKRKAKMVGPKVCGTMRRCKGGKKNAAIPAVCNGGACAFFKKAGAWFKKMFQKLKDGAAASAITYIVEDFVQPYLGKFAEWLKGQVGGRFTCQRLTDWAVPYLDRFADSLKIKWAWDVVKKFAVEAFNDLICEQVVDKVCNAAASLESAIEKAGGAASLEAYRTLTGLMCDHSGSGSGAGSLVQVEHWEENETPSVHKLSLSSH